VALQTVAGHRTGETADDLRTWLTRLEGCPTITRTTLATCSNAVHGDEPAIWFYVQADAREAVAQRRCLSCGESRDVLDSAEHWNAPRMWSCPTCSQSIAEVAAGFHSEDGDDNDEDEPTAGGGEVPDGDGEDANDPSELVPGAPVKPPSPTLAKAPLVWTGTRKILQARIDALKDVVQAQVADEGDDVIDEITVNLQKVDRILERLDQRLADSLARAADAYGGERSAAMKESKAILAEYIRYVGDEPLIDHLDKNPFGVKVDLKATLSQSLTQVAKAIG